MFCSNYTYWFNLKEIHYYPYIVTLEKCGESWNTLHDLSNRLCAPITTDDVNVKVFNMITKINKSKLLLKYISCDRGCRLDGKRCNSKQTWNGIMFQCAFKKS